MVYLWPCAVFDLLDSDFQATTRFSKHVPNTLSTTYLCIMLKIQETQHLSNQSYSPELAPLRGWFNGCHKCAATGSMHLLPYHTRSCRGTGAVDGHRVCLWRLSLLLQAMQAPFSFDPFKSEIEVARRLQRITTCQ